MILSLWSSDGREDRGAPGGMAARLVGLGEWLFTSPDGNISAFNNPCGRGRPRQLGVQPGDAERKESRRVSERVVEERPLGKCKDYTTPCLPCALWMNGNLSSTSSSTSGDPVRCPVF